MADYWKSLPKKYCDFCKCWFTDNKASVEFHEKGFKHQNNVKRKLQELQKRGAKQVKEENKYNLEMMRIEASAMKAFHNDVSLKPELAKELATNVSLFKKSDKTQSTLVFGSRYGDDSSCTEESSVLVRGRQSALETISKKLEKKSKWLAGKTAEGKTYYWNKETMETKWTEPKTGFLSQEEQKYSTEMATDFGPLSATYRYDPYGSWKTVKNTAFDDKMVDLQLPNQQMPEFVAPVVSEEVRVKTEFKEKTVESLKNKVISNSDQKISFKKRKSNSDSKRNVRQRKADDD